MPYFQYETPVTPSTGTALASSLQVYSDGTAETFDRLEGIRTSRSLSSGVLYLTALTPNEDVTGADEISVYVTTAGSTLTLVRLGLYTFDGTTYTLVARSADVKASFGSNNAFVTATLNTTGGYPATYDLVANTLYYAGMIVVGTTPPAVNGPSTPSSVAGVSSFMNSGTPKLARSLAGQTDLPTSVAESSMNNSVVMLYTRFS